MFFHQNLMLILIFKIVSPKNVFLKSYKHLSEDQPPVHDLFANRYFETASQFTLKFCITLQCHEK